MIIVTAVIETEERFAGFLGSADQPERNFSWWLYSLGTYREVLKMLGFRITAVNKNMYRCPFHGSDTCRYTIVAARE